MTFTTAYSNSTHSVTKTSGDLPDGATFSFTGTYTNATQMTAGKSQTLTLSGFNGYTITNITLSMKSNVSSGAGVLAYSTNGGTTYSFLVGSSTTNNTSNITGVAFSDAAWNGAYTGTYTNISKDVNIEVSSSDVCIYVRATSNSLYCQSYSITYQPSASSSAVATTTTIDDSGITNTDVYAGTAAGSLSASVTAGGNAVEGASVTWTSSDESVATIDENGVVTLVSAGTVTFTASYAGVADEYQASSGTYEMTVTDSTPVPTHTVTFSVNGTTTSDDVEEGADIVFPDNPASIEGKVFCGWVAAAIDGTTDEKPDFVASATATMGTSDVTYYAVFADLTPGTSSTVSDVLTRETTGVTGTSYSSWSGKTVTSSAVYAGQSASDNSSIQLRSKNSNSGVISTTSGGTLKKIAVEWESHTADGNELQVYGNTSDYTNPTDLYNEATDGDLLGTIVCGTSTELVITGDYTHVGLRSKNGAMYLTSITITWVTGTPDTYSGYCTTLPVSAPTFGTPAGSFNAAFNLTLSCATAGATIYYTTDGTTPSASSTEYTAPIAIPAATTTVKAIAVKGGISSEVASATYTYVSKETPTFSLSDTELNLKVNEDGEITLTTNSNGEVTFECDDANVTIVADGKDALIAASAAGTYTVTVTVAETTNYLRATGDVTVNVTKYATTTAIDATDITNTDVNADTKAGSLSATVTPEGKSALASPEITWTSSDENVATVNELGEVTLVAKGTTTITASFAGDDENAASSDTYVLSVVDTGVTLWSENFGSYAADAVPSSGVNATYTCVDGGSATKIYREYLAGGNPPELLVGKTTGSFTATLKDMQFCTGTLTLTFKVNNTNISVSATSTSGDVEVTGDIGIGENSLTLTLPEKPADLTIIFANKKSSNVRLDNIVLRGIAGDTYYRNVTAGNFGTVCLPRAASNLSTAGATFYEVAGTTESGLMLSEVDELEAGTPYVFKATASKLSIPVTGSETTVQSATGLVGNMSTTPVEVTNGNYILSSNLLRKVNGGKATIGQYRAYFDLSAVPEYSGAGVKTFVLGMDETPDGIKAISDATAEGAIYTLAGQRVNKAQKGIYIVNGKKILK